MRTSCILRDAEGNPNPALASRTKTRCNHGESCGGKESPSCEHQIPRFFTAGLERLGPAQIAPYGADQNILVVVSDTGDLVGHELADRMHQIEPARCCRPRVVVVEPALGLLIHEFVRNLAKCFPHQFANCARERDRWASCQTFAPTGSIVKASGFGYTLTKPGLASWAVVEPLRRSLTQAWIMAGQRCQFAAVGGLIQSKAWAASLE